MSIATCGHEVYEGISCSIYESENEWSFGTYCVDCLKLYHAEGVLVDNEAKKLCDELAQQQAMLDEACELLKESNDGFIITSKATTFLEKVKK